MSEIFSKILKDKNGKVLNVGSKYTQPEWGSEVAEVEILPQTSFGADQSQGGVWTSTSPLLEHLKVGKEYTVNWNGKDYSCTAYAGNDCVLIGNGSLFGVVDETTDDPFVFMELPENVQQGAGMYAQLCAGDGSTYVTISIKTVEETIHKLPSKYVEGVGKYKQPEWGAETSIVDILPETELTILEDAGASLIMQEVPLTAGNVYTVNFNGTKYACTAYDNGDNAVIIGNLSAADEDLPATDEPFLFMTIPEEGRENYMGACAIAVPLDGSASFTLSIKSEGEVIHTIPAAYVENAYVLNVNLKMDYSAADKTYDEIMAAINAGKYVVARMQGTDDENSPLTFFLILTSIDLQSRICFVLLGMGETICCNPDNTWEKYNV